MMSSCRHLREFIRERLSVAAEEIFTEVEKTIVRYEADIRLLEIYWKPQIKLPRIELQEQRVYNEEEVSTIQQLYQGRRSKQDLQEAEPQLTDNIQMKQDHLTPPIKDLGKPGPLWIKEEDREPTSPLFEIKKEPESSLPKHEQWLHEPLAPRQDQTDLHSSQEEDQPVHRQSFSLMDTFTLQEVDLSETKSIKDQFAFYVCPGVETKRHEGGSSAVSESPPQTDSKKKLFKCEICGRCFNKKYTMKRHFRSHTGEKPFPCKTCGRRFSHVSHLKDHTRIHTGEKPFQCKTCGKHFARMYSLTVHTRTHTGQRPFPCQTCGKNFTHVSSLNVHRRTHTGEKPFACKTCGKSFSQVTSLNVHRRTHTGEKPFPCKTCGKSFAQVSNLNAHTRAHENEKLLSCQICRENFTDNGRLKFDMN